MTVTPFLWEGSPTKIDYRKNGTLILTSLLEDLVTSLFLASFFVVCFVGSFLVGGTGNVAANLSRNRSSASAQARPFALSKGRLPPPPPPSCSR